MKLKVDESLIKKFFGSFFLLLIRTIQINAMKCEKVTDFYSNRFFCLKTQGSTYQNCLNFRKRQNLKHYFDHDTGNLNASVFSFLFFTIVNVVVILCLKIKVKKSIQQNFQIFKFNSSRWFCYLFISHRLNFLLLLKFKYSL